MRKLHWVLLVTLLAGLLVGCTPAAQPAAVVEEPAAATAAPVATDVPAATTAPLASGELILATTTSTRDSGLLDVLLPMFEEQTGVTVKMVAVGSGAALQMGEEGNADVLLVHAPKSELALMDKGFGKDRLLVMHNDFILVGPASDPAAIRGMTSAADAFKQIAVTESTFVSRGDDSGTNKSELAFWKKLELTPEGEWYVSTGSGMGDTLRVASEKQGYTYTDRATFLALKDTLQLEVLVEGDPSLLNVYHVITVNPAAWPKVNYDAAVAFANFMVAPETLAVIAAFGVDLYGQPLFIPDAGKTEAEVGL
jgi:tungstate transport system substrate-binding protein